MGLFANDEQQDQRLDSIESYLRMLTEIVQQNELDVSSVRLHLVKTQTQLDEKISTDEIDPEFIALNQLLGDARRQMMQASSASEESWLTLQAGARDAFDTLRARLQAADCTGEGPS